MVGRRGTVGLGRTGSAGGARQPAKSPSLAGRLLVSRGHLVVAVTFTFGLVLGVTGCGLTPGGSIQVKLPPRATPTPRPSSLPTDSFLVEATNVFGILPSSSVHVSCQSGGRQVELSGVADGAHFEVTMSHLRPGQRLTDPPLQGGFEDQITMVVTKSGAGSSLRYVAGAAAGTYQGVGTLTVDRSGEGGTISIQFGPPEGENPSSQTSGDVTTTGLNDGQVSGTWRCP